MSFLPDALEDVSPYRHFYYKNDEFYWSICFGIHMKPIFWYFSRYGSDKCWKFYAGHRLHANLFQAWERFKDLLSWISATSNTHPILLQWRSNVQFQENLRNWNMRELGNYLGLIDGVWAFHWANWRISDNEGEPWILEKVDGRCPWSPLGRGVDSLSYWKNSGGQSSSSFEKMSQERFRHIEEEKLKILRRWPIQLEKKVTIVILENSISLCNLVSTSGCRSNLPTMVEEFPNIFPSEKTHIFWRASWQ